MNAGSIDDPSSEDWAVFTFACSESQCDFECRFDNPSFEPCSSGVGYDPLDDGHHTFSVRATDPAGNTGATQQFSWEIDTVPPVVENLAGPENPTNEESAQFSFECSKNFCDYQCSLAQDGQGIIEDPATCSSGVEYSIATDGEYTFSVTAIDEAGNNSSAETWNWTVDTTPPEVTSLSGPATLTGSTSAELTFDCSESDCTYFCALADNSGEVEPEAQCNSGITFTGLADDDYVFTVYAVDAAGNEGPTISTGWTVDTNPSVEDLAGPPTETNTDEAVFTFACSSPDCTFECSLNGTSYSSCTSGDDFGPMSDGEHTFSVRAIDSYDNTGDAESWTWSVNATPPEIVLLETPPLQSPQYWATIAFECANDESCSFQCAVDSDTDASGWDLGNWRNCASPRDANDLEPGEYRWRIRATDDFGNQATTSYEWTVLEAGWVDRAAGDEHACGIDVDGGLWCWGKNDYGELGQDDREFRLEPTQVGSNTDWSAVTAGHDHNCALRTDGTLWCWGRGRRYAHGQIDDNDRLIPHQLFGYSDWEDLTSGDAHSCAIRDGGKVYCWGANQSGQAGEANEYNVITPTQVEDDNDWVNISAGGAFTCGVRGSSTLPSLYCWGSNGEGELGRGHPLSYESSPQHIGYSWESVAAGKQHACGIKTDGALYCWGNNDSSQLGLDSFSQRTPHRIGDSNAWAKLDAGDEHTCGIQGDGSLWCWGRNNLGQLGLDDTDTRREPAQVGDDTDWVQVEVARTHTCARREDDSLWCWGSNSRGQLGVDDTTTRYVPTLVTTIDDVAYVTNGFQRTCALRDNGTIWCWGQGYGGALGQGDTEDRWNPTQVGDHTDWTHISMNQHVHALRGQGRPWSWGRSNDGRLGDGSLWKIEPTRIPAP